MMRLFPRTRGGNPIVRQYALMCAVDNAQKASYTYFGSLDRATPWDFVSAWLLFLPLFSPTRGGTEAVSSVNGKTHGAICTVGFRILSSKPAQRPRYSLVTDAAAACFCTRSMPQSSRSLAATFGPLYSLVSSNGRNASCPSAVT